MTGESSEIRGTRAQYIFVTILTVARAPLILLFMIGAIIAVFKPDFRILPWVNLLFMILSALTDMFDGILARRWRVTSKFGALCDPLTDKIFSLVVFPTLTALIFIDALGGEMQGRIHNNPEMLHGVLMLCFTVFYLLRDQWVSFLRAIASGKTDMRANWIGKCRTALSFPIGCAIYAHLELAWPWLPLPLIISLEVLGIIINFYSSYVYTKRYSFALKDSVR